MKKIENLKSNLFKKFEENRIENLNSIFGGDPGTLQSSDCSDSNSDCTCTSSDTTSWSTDSTATGDTVRASDGCNPPKEQ